MIKKIEGIIVKTLCAVQPKLSRAFRSCQPMNTTNNMCFEILGFDILLDNNLKPWLLEVNHSPSFNIDTPFDNKLKTELITDTIILLHIDPLEKMNYIEEERKRITSRTYLRVMQDSIRKEDKEKLIENFMKIRDKYELTNCGNYTCIYPNPDIQQSYQDYIDYANAEMDHFYGIKKRIPVYRQRPLSGMQAPLNPLLPVPIKASDPKYLVKEPSINKKIIQNYASDKWNRIVNIYGSKLLQEKLIKNSKIGKNSKKSIPDYKISVVDKKVVFIRPQTSAISGLKTLYGNPRENMK